jgi:hypothetical protein
LAVNGTIVHVAMSSRRRGGAVQSPGLSLGAERRSARSGVFLRLF